jgi:hypothetical protein
VEKKCICRRTLKATGQIKRGYSAPLRLVCLRTFMSSQKKDLSEWSRAKGPGVEPVTVPLRVAGTCVSLEPISVAGTQRLLANVERWHPQFTGDVTSQLASLNGASIASVAQKTNVPSAIVYDSLYRDSFSMGGQVVDTGHMYSSPPFTPTSRPAAGTSSHGRDVPGCLAVEANFHGY